MSAIPRGACRWLAAKPRCEAPSVRTGRPRWTSQLGLGRPGGRPLGSVSYGGEWTPDSHLAGGVNSPEIDGGASLTSGQLSTSRWQALPKILTPGEQGSLEEAVFRVISKQALNRRTTTVRLAPLEAELHFRAGQYVLLADGEGEVQPRSYSVANAARSDGELNLVMTLVPDGQSSQWVSERLEVGDKVLISGPYGNFVRGSADLGPTLFLAGGVGLAPILALLDEALSSGLTAPLLLIFSARTQADVIYRSRLLEWQEEHTNFRFIRTLTREWGEPPLGRVPTLLPRLVDSLAKRSVYAAGPQGFVDACAVVARELGVQSRRLHTEAFFLEPQPWGGGLA